MKAGTLQWVGQSPGHWSRRRKWILGKSIQRVFLGCIDRNLQSLPKVKSGWNVENWKSWAWCHCLWTQCLPENSTFFFASTLLICVMANSNPESHRKVMWGEYSFLYCVSMILRWVTPCTLLTIVFPEHSTQYIGGKSSAVCICWVQWTWI